MARQLLVLGIAVALLTLTGCVVNPVPTPGKGGVMQETAHDTGQRPGPDNKDDNGAAGEADTTSPTAGASDASPPSADGGAPGDVDMSDTPTPADDAEAGVVADDIAEAG